MCWLVEIGRNAKALFHGFAGEGDGELQSIKNGLLKIAYSQRDTWLNPSV
jgi:hypothetical protein